uniref:DUF4097 family beta strand repeat-containing protein n=1 Tax=Edaphobacter bradus TaxID=2259016 RepID=UPI0021E04151|nr:DUF4097 domain-containing protein [Edaphobacter bradus]
MKVRILLAAATLAITTAAFADGNFDRTLNVSASPNVSVATGSGYIRLKPGSDNQVHIIGHVHAGHGWKSGDVESRVQQVIANPPITQNGNDITIGGRHGDNDLFHNISIDYDITLPRTSNIAATTGSGDMEIQDVGASVKAQTGSGSIRANGVQGPATLGTGSGDVELHHSGPGDVKAETGSGSLRLYGVSGALKASTGSGDVQVDGQPSTDWKLSTGSGSIQLALGNAAHFNLNADTGSGSIRVDQPITMQGSLNRHHVSGVVNGGGPTIRANTGSGDITVH